MYHKDTFKGLDNNKIIKILKKRLKLIKKIQFTKLNVI